MFLLLATIIRGPLRLRYRELGGAGGREKIQERGIAAFVIDAGRNRKGTRTWLDLSAPV
jgi:hypothetical protein